MYIKHVYICICTCVYSIRFTYNIYYICTYIMYIKVVKLYTKKAKGMNLGFQRMLISGGERKEVVGMGGEITCLDVDPCRGSNTICAFVNA